MVTAIRWLARAVVWIFYRVERTGSPIPAGSVLLVANHPNALLDPAVIWTTAGRDLRFLAKSTIFDVPLVGRFFAAAGAIPVYRRMDRGADISKNAQTFESVDAALAAGDVVCLFPEGRSHSTGRLEELKTGAARMALASEAKGIHVVLVAVGLNFDETPAFRSRVTVAFGAPFMCQDLMAADGHDVVERLTDRIAERLRALLIEADPITEAQVVERIDRLYRAARRLPNEAEARLERRRAIATGIAALRARDPARYDAISTQIRAYDASLRRFRLADEDVDNVVARRAAIRFAVREAAYALVLVPLAITARFVFAVPYWLTDVVARREPNREARATWKVVAGAIFYGSWTLLVSAVVAWGADPLAGLLCFVALPVLGTLGLLAIERELDVMATSRSYLGSRLTPGPIRRRLERRRGAIAAILEETYSWLHTP